MSFGLQAYSATGELTVDINGTVGFVIGFGSVSHAVDTFGDRTLSLPGLIDSDDVAIVTDNKIAVYTATRGAGFVTVSRVSGGPTSGAVTYWITGIRVP